jgi:hypothetical protein
VEVGNGRVKCKIQDGALAQTREHVLLARQVGVPNLIVDERGKKVFGIKGDTLVDAGTGAPIVRVDGDLEGASDGRVLSVAALVAGLCR